MVRRFFLLATVLAALVVALAATAATPRSHDRLPLHVGSSGPQVCKLKYLVRDPRPAQNAFKKVKGLYKGAMCSADPSAGYLGASFGKIIYSYKYRLGYPTRFNNQKHPVAGKYFFDLLRGRKQRTKEMVALAQQRLRLVEPGVTTLALRIKALEVSQLGVYESPPHCNCGPHISYPWPRGGYPSYQSATGAYYAAWCASFQQWAFRQAGFGTFADRSAGVLYIEQWSRARGLLNGKVHVGSLVAYLDDGGHIGFVSRVTASGYAEISGNTSDSVRETWHPWNYRLRVFINLPGV